ncbi:hypothetical protein HIM_00927 [Hirsutella minnesotensis 3608]|nr:hypothetical protein HIM_00927 [Hirsutella minnesotensis 3608]
MRNRDCATLTNSKAEAMSATIQDPEVTGQVSNGDPESTMSYSADSHGDAVRALSLLAESRAAGQVIDALIAQLPAAASSPDQALSSKDLDVPASDILAVGLAALDAFLQTNVTGPVLPIIPIRAVETRFSDAWKSLRPSNDDNSPPAALRKLRRACLIALDVDGVSPYSLVPYLELFCLARFVFVHALERTSSQGLVEVESPYSGKKEKYSVGWMRLRINIWHYKLLTQPTMGHGSNFAKSSQWSDVPTLASQILDSMDTLFTQICGDDAWSTTEIWDREQKTEFLLEAANNYIILGHHEKARNMLKEATKTSGLQYALSGALGKRTRFQEKSTSQLVVLARSAEKSDLTSTDGSQQGDKEAKPDALQLNDDTLLEEIHFTKDGDIDDAKPKVLPSRLADLSPDEQPQLSPLDQIILLTDATLKDAFSPIDTLTSEEVLPFAVRVLADKSTNWQIYTQALLVRSRIELHRSRTVERGVLQLQAVADQVLADTSGHSNGLEDAAANDSEAANVPAIQVTAPGGASTSSNGATPSTFLPAPKVSESAPAHLRLRYLHALCTPPRWHLESELAHAWAGVGSLASALEIFKRLRLWAEVALCLASAAAYDDEGGRGSGGEERAKAIIRWRLFCRNGSDSSTCPDEEGVEDVTLLKASDYSGLERTPTPSNAPRLWCILGDLEDEPAHYERAWEISRHRYARAQKSLGEHYLQQKEWEKALAAYKLATAVNRLSPDMWGRLGDISLRLGQFEEAAEAYSRSIGSATDTLGGEDARTWSNLGSALWSLYREVLGQAKESDCSADSKHAKGDDEDEEPSVEPSSDKSRDPSTLLAQSLAAYKKGASIAHDNWRIWDNVLTLASRMQPPPVSDIVLAFKHILRIRKSEEVIDSDVLAALLEQVVLTKDKDGESGIYEPPRGSPERMVTKLLEDDVLPLITQRAELWALVARLRTWQRDYAGAIDASERAWRAAVGSSGSGGGGLLPGQSSSSSDWTSDADAWAEVVKRTDELVSVLENWGPQTESVGSRWRGKARNAVRSVMGRARENWEGSDGWKTLEGIMESLKADR